jgi:hypothetical protein
LIEFSLFVINESIIKGIEQKKLHRGKYVITDKELMNIHVNALFTHDIDSRILYVNEPAGATIPAPRMFLGRTSKGNVWRFHADLPASLLGKLKVLCADEPLSTEFNKSPRHLETYIQLLERHAPIRRIAAGPAYHFPQYVKPSKNLLAITEKNAKSLEGGFEELIADISVEQPFIALIDKNRAVSVCRSVRVTTEAHEAGVETLPDFRGKGYAKEVAAGWAQLVRASGAAPLYSTSWKNTASQAVAKKLQLKIYGVDFHIT